MDTSNWLKALGLFLTYPVLIIALFLIACAAFGFAWWLRGHIGKERIDALNERLRLATDNQQSIERQVDTLKNENTKQGAIINELKTLDLANSQADKLSSANTIVQNELTKLAQATTALGSTLQIVRFPTTASRQFTDQTAENLLALYDNKMPLQAEPLIAKYKGLWIRVYGQVITILADGRPQHSVAVLKDGKRTIECRLGPEWNDQAVRLNKDEWVNVQGRIAEHQNGSQLYLLDCEFISGG